MKKFLSFWSVLALIAVTGACTKSSPSRPSDAAAPAEAGSSVTDAATGITITTPQPQTPTPGQRFRFAEQPLTVTVRNAVSTGSGSVAYGFQVASDAAFATVVFSKEGVAQGSGQTTSLQLDKLAGAKDYFYRARAVSGGVTGPWATPRSFNVGPEVILQPPGQISPANFGQLSGNALLQVANVGRTGPAGTLSYRFEVSDAPSFGNLIFVSTVTEGSGQTSTQMNVRLTTNGTYFWRARATDPSNAVDSPYSSTWQFKYVPFDFAGATILNSPPDIASWPEAARITRVDFTGGSFNVDFDRRDGPDRWPDVTPAGWSGALQYTLGMCVNDQGHWYCSGVVQFWHGRELEASAPPSLVGREWFYDPSRWGPIVGYQPQDGETVALWVGAGNLRDGANFTRASCPRVCERSNAVLVPWSNGGAASYVYSAGAPVRR